MGFFCISQILPINHFSPLPPQPRRKPLTPLRRRAAAPGVVAPSTRTRATPECRRLSPGRGVHQGVGVGIAAGRGRGLGGEGATSPSRGSMSTPTAPDRPSQRARSIRPRPRAVGGRGRAMSPSRGWRSAQVTTPRRIHPPSRRRTRGPRLRESARGWPWLRESARGWPWRTAAPIAALPLQSHGVRGGPPLKEGGDGRGRPRQRVWPRRERARNPRRRCHPRSGGRGDGRGQGCRRSMPSAK